MGQAWPHGGSGQVTLELYSATIDSANQIAERVLIFMYVELNQITWVFVSCQKIAVTESTIESAATTGCMATSYEA